MTKWVKIVALCVTVGVLVCGLLVINFLRPDGTDDGQAQKTTTTSSREAVQDEDIGDVEVIIPNGSSEEGDTTKTGATASSSTAKGTTTTSTRGSDKDGTKDTVETATSTRGSDKDSEKDTTKTAITPTRGVEDDGWLPDVGTKANVEP